MVPLDSVTYIQNLFYIRRRCRCRYRCRRRVGENLVTECRVSRRLLP